VLFSAFIPIVPEVLTVLLNIQCYPNSKYVFGERRKGLFRRVDHQLATIAPKIGVRHLGLHTLRHTFFSRLVNYGAAVTTVMAIGGWKSISTTCKFFARIQPVPTDNAGMNQAI
jgi:integrase